MDIKYPSKSFVLIIITESFDEVEAISILVALREAGIYTKTIGLTSGLITGLHGIPIMPDYALINLSNQIDMSTINVIILPGTNRSFTKLESDPRIHRLLRQIIAKHGIIATNTQGKTMLKRILGQDQLAQETINHQILLRAPQSQTVDTFAQIITRRLERP
jgi:putative intracellular protease/amidase